MARKEVFAVAIVLGAFPARAAYASCSTPIVSPCIDSDTFWPHAGPTQLMTVGGTETVAADRLAFGLVASYLKDPIRLMSPSPGPTGNASPAVGNQLDLTFLFAYGLTDRLELDLALPVTVYEDGAGTSPIGGTDVPTTASRDLRFGFTYSILRRPKKHPWRRDASGFGLAARFEMVAPTGDDTAFATEPTAVYAPSLSMDYRYRTFFAGAELGLRVRPITDFVGARIGTQAVIALGAGFDVLRNERLSFTGEVRLLPTFADQGIVSVTPSGFQSTDNPGAYIVPAEWMVTARTAPFEGGDITFQLGVGGALPVNETCYSAGGSPQCSWYPATTPAFRTALSVIFAPRGRDTDGDGVPDAVDRCPLEPGPKSNSGCPRP